MPEVSSDDISPFDATLAARMAVEGIPVRAMARVLGQPSDKLYDALRDAKERGEITSVPRDDWPPRQGRDDHTPTHYAEMDEQDFQFLISKRYKLTKLQCLVFIALLRSQHYCRREKLHSIIENLRNTRSTRPDDLEPTDPKMVDVIVCNLRKRLRVVDKSIAITTAWGDGYYIAPEIKKSIYEALGTDGKSAH